MTNVKKVNKSHAKSHVNYSATFAAICCKACNGTLITVMSVILFACYLCLCVITFIPDTIASIAYGVHNYRDLTVKTRRNLTKLERLAYFEKYASKARKSKNNKRRRLFGNVIKHCQRCFYAI